jgi:prepilin-type N-terminal cleavage/methylation domain-containing protein
MRLTIRFTWYCFRSKRKRTGFSLIELIVAITLAGMLGAAIMMTLRRQERLYSASSEMLRVRGQLRDATDVLVSDIRGSATARYGLPLMTDSALELFTSIGGSVVCSPSSGRTLFLPPTRLSSGTSLTSLLALPDTGDLALVYSVRGGNPDSAQWMEFRIAAFAARSLGASCPPSTGFTSSLDATAGRTGYALTLASTPVEALRKGAPVRFLRRGRYSLYRSSDGDWYLGYRRCNAIGQSACSTIQPVSGPYLPYGGGAPNDAGLAFHYFDAAGNEIVDASLSAAVARIDVVLRGETMRAVSLAGDARTRYRDSAVVAVSPRNRAR